MIWQVGEADVVRGLFQTSGSLNNTMDQQFRAISDRWPVFAFAHDLGTVGTTKTAPVAYTIGYVRDPLVRLSNIPGVNTVRGPYYLTRYGSIPGMVRPSSVLYVTVLMQRFAGLCAPRRLSQYPGAHDRF